MHLRCHFALVFIVVTCLPLTYANSEFRIINGFDWDIADSPYLVAVNYGRKNICVGSLLTMQKVVTAAHCVYDRYASLFTIIAGATNIRHLSVTGQSRAVERADYPCEFNFQGHMDIAVIKMTKTFEPSPTVHPISLCETTLTEGTQMQVFGWGYTMKRGKSSPTLKSAILHVTSFDQCAQRYLWKTLTQAMICATGVSDTCEGDSGSPGVVDGTLCALVSNGLDCDHTLAPTILTNINDPDVQKFICITMTY